MWLSCFTKRASWLALITLLVFSSLTAYSNPSKLILPTDNNHIFSGSSEKFYMYVDRHFEGKKSKPWTGGKYGFVRTLKRTKDGVVGTKFHEGIDIKPLKRDAKNNPKDEIRAIASGVVAYVNSKPARSNYGNYVVIEHQWPEGPIFSLYAHLSQISVQVGERVKQGQAIGIMGFTGAGINRARSHLHLELGIMLSPTFTKWHDHFLGGKNDHGNHNGLNLAGLDIANYYLRLRHNPSLSLPNFLTKTPTYYKITVPRKGSLFIVKQYPWLAKGDHQQTSPSWEISFSASGFPLAVAPSRRAVKAPQVTSVRKCLSKHEYHTKGIIGGTSYRAKLTASGERFIKLITGDFPTKKKAVSEG